MKCTGPVAAFSTAIDPDPSVESRRIALFARVFPVEKLIALARGVPVPAGWIVRWPGAVDWVTVRFAATLLAEEGIPQAPASANVRPD